MQALLLKISSWIGVIPLTVFTALIWLVIRSASLTTYILLVKYGGDLILSLFPKAYINVMWEVKENLLCYDKSVGIGILQANKQKTELS